MQVSMPVVRKPINHLAQKQTKVSVRAISAQAVAAPKVSPLESAKTWLMEKALPAVAQAKGTAMEAYFWVLYGSPIGDFKTREELEVPSTRYMTANNSYALVKAYRANAAKEEEAIVALGARGMAYRSLVTLCGDDWGAKIALQNMLFNGRLTAQRDALGKDDALSHLTRLMATNLISGQDKTQMITDLIEEIENPTKISQGAKGTCAATSATIMMARRNPAEYARLIADLASPAGQSVLSDGTVIRRDRNWDNSRDQESRTTSLRLLQPALMEVGNGWMGYDNQRDVHNPMPFLSVPAVRAVGLGVAVLGLAMKSANPALRWGLQIAGSAGVLLAGKTFGGGMSPKGFAKVDQGLLGGKFEAVGVNRLNKNKNWKRLEATLAKGTPVEVGLVFGPGGHALVAERIEKGFVYYTNPWGQTERMGTDEFKKRFMGAAFPVA